MKRFTMFYRGLAFDFRRLRSSRKLIVSLTIFAVLMFSALWITWSVQGSDTETLPDARSATPTMTSAKPSPTHAHPYQVDEDTEVCADTDWSVLEKVWTFTTDSWDTDLTEALDGIERDDGTGLYNCGANLPVAGISNGLWRPQVFGQITVYLGNTSAEDAFTEDVDGLDDYAEDWKSMNIDTPETCDELHTSTHRTELAHQDGSDSRDNVPVLDVLCLTDNATIDISIHNFDADDGSGPHNAEYMAKHAAVPLINELRTRLSPQ